MLSFANKDLWVKGKLVGEGTLIPHPHRGHSLPGPHPLRRGVQTEDPLSWQGSQADSLPQPSPRPPNARETFSVLAPGGSVPPSP